MPGLSRSYSCQMRILKTLPYIIRRLITKNSSICHPSNHAKVKNKRNGQGCIQFTFYLIAVKDTAISMPVYTTGRRIS